VDFTDPKVYIDFFPHHEKDVNEGWVLIEHLADKPAGVNTDDWLSRIKRTADLNPRIAEDTIVLDGLPGLRVRYRNPHNGGYEIESVYIVSGTQTFAVSFSAERAGITLVTLKNYPVYVHMLSTFKIAR
jgi:hypothetical protein